ncbi:MAG: polysaccharide lyase 6 family protein, partial [Armatimonadota bacterium]
MFQHQGSLASWVALIVAAFCWWAPCRAAELPAASPEELARAVERAQPGDSIIVTAGRYADWTMSLSCRGTAEQPIVLRPDAPGAVTFTGKTSLQLRGHHVVVRGFTFDGCVLPGKIVLFQQATHCRVTECRFLNSNSGSGSAVVTFNDGADDNRLDYCEIINTVGRCVQVRVGNYAVEHGPPSRNRIDHNLFQDVPPKGSNGRETIQIGSNQRDYGHLEPQTLVEHNLFLRCDGEGEIISNKSSRNTYRHNLFRDCRGALVMRGGHYCLIEANRFEGCDGGIRLHGTHHRVVHNVVVDPRGTGIRLAYGATVEQGGIYQATADCFIAHNTVVGAPTIGIHIGMNRNRDWGEWGVLKCPPRGNRIERNVIVGSAGDLIKVEGSPDNTIDANLLHATGEATVSNPGTNAIRADPG